MHKQFLTKPKQDFETYYCGTVRYALIAVSSDKLAIILNVLDLTEGPRSAKDSFHGVVLRFTTTIYQTTKITGSCTNFFGNVFFRITTLKSLNLENGALLLCLSHCSFIITFSHHKRV